MPLVYEVFRAMSLRMVKEVVKALGTSSPSASVLSSLAMPTVTCMRLLIPESRANPPSAHPGFR